MPYDRSRYPANWDELKALVRARSEGRCEAAMPDGSRCNAPDGKFVVRPFRDPERWEAWSPYSFESVLEDIGGRVVKVVLTTAHLDHDPEVCQDVARLAHWCQLHHLRYDAAQHANSAAATRRRRRMEQGQGALAL